MSDEFHLSGDVTCHMRHPSGKVDEIEVGEPDKFDYEKRVYNLKKPFSHPETAERILVYNVGNPNPLVYDGDESDKLMGEVNTSQVISQLATPDTSSEMDLLAMLQRVPIWVPVTILAFIVMLQQGTLGGLLPF